MRILGLDVGGANIKYALVEELMGKSKLIKASSKHFPIWVMGRERLRGKLLEVKREVGGIDALSLTMTAELSDVFYTKREGVHFIVESVSRVFSDVDELRVVDYNCNLISVSEALNNPISVAAANWSASGWLAGRVIGNCILIDVGSTTTDIIPVINGYPKTIGKTDFERLVHGELIYTGALRTPIFSIVSEVPFRGLTCKVVAEKFAIAADIHLILGNISPSDYSCDTPDGRGKSVEECMARLARIISLDIELASPDELISLANYIYEKQIKLIVSGLRQVLKENPDVDLSLKVAVTGIGRKFLAEKAALKTGFKEIIDLEHALKIPVNVLTAYAAAELLVSKYE